MTTDRDATRIVRSWLEEGVTRLPDAVLDRVLDQLPSTPQRKPLWRARRLLEMTTVTKLLAAAAVVAVAVVALSLRLSDVQGPGGIVSPSPGPSSSVSQTARPVPAGGILEGGTWYFTVDGLRVTFTTPGAGWQKNAAPNVIWTANSEARLGFGSGETPYADPCDWSAGLLEPPVGPGADELAAALAALPGVDPSPPSDVVVDGYQGKLVELNPPEDQLLCDGDGMRLHGDVPLEGGRHRFWIIDVDGTRLVITAVDRPPASQGQRDQLDAIVGSLSIEQT